MHTRNLSMMTDLYQLTMMHGYFKNGMGENLAVFDLFYRKAGEVVAHAIAAGLEQAVSYVTNLRFEDDDIAYLRSLSLFDEDFLAYLRAFRFTGDLYAVPEGTLVFPGEPIVKVSAPLMQAQLIETALLNIINHQTLIATKASRVVQAAGTDSVLEFGLRRAQGPDAGILGARAAVIGGCHATSNVLAGKLYNIPVRGTHAHSWVMSFATELEAFRAYAAVYPTDCLLLVDTYDTLKSGVPNAIRVFTELREKGHKGGIGIRLDSGDMAYLSRKSREMLDSAGFPDARICASSDLDEEVIWDLKAQGARVDIWGVGTRMITSQNHPALGGVYKLVAEEVNGNLTPRIKISENPAKVTNPGDKALYRIYDRTGHAIADLIALADEVYKDGAPLLLFDPENTWKQMTVTEYAMRQLLIPIIKGGELVYTLPPIDEIAAYAQRELATLWPEYKRLNKPHYYKVDLSRPLWDMKDQMLRNARAAAR